jgi:hypothetical protein
MNTLASRRSLAKSLEVIAEFVSANPAEAPVDFVRELARSWKAMGGFLSGKPRHSHRYLDELLRLQGTHIRSLTPKLVGRTNLRPTDAGILVRLFLSYWRYIGNSNVGESVALSSDVYEPMLPAAEVGEVSAFVAEQIAVREGETRTAAGESDSAGAIASSPVGQDTIELIASEFEESIAFFTAAIGSAVLTPSDETALVGFRRLMDWLWTIERSDRRGRIPIWMVDLGRQVFDDPESRKRFMHVQQLIARFKALVLFKDDDTWSWLQSRAIIVLHDIRSGQRDASHLPAFDPHHVLFSAIPPKWAGSRHFIELYGREPSQANYSIFLRPPAQFHERKGGPDQSAIAGQSYTLRYFGHALFKTGENSDPDMRGLSLEAPGWSYVEALGTVFVAARQVLGLPEISTELVIDGIKIDPDHAIEKLRHHGFRLLRLDQFVGF